MGFLDTELFTFNGYISASPLLPRVSSAEILKSYFTNSPSLCSWYYHIWSLNYNDITNIKNLEPSFGLPNGITTFSSNSSYFFLVAAPNKSTFKSRAFTGLSDLFVKNNKLSYAHNNPTYNFDISGSLYSINTLLSYISTNNISLQQVYSNSLFLNSSVSAISGFYTDSLSSYIIVVDNFTQYHNDYQNQQNTNDQAVGILKYNNNISAKIGGTLTVNNLTVLNEISASVLKNNSSSITKLSADYLYTDLLSSQTFSIPYAISFDGSINAVNMKTFLDLDPQSGLYYDVENNLSLYMPYEQIFGIKPSDSHSTDDENTLRIPNGAWDNNFTDTFGVNKPFFKTLNETLRYIQQGKLYGSSVKIFIYEDIIEGHNNSYADGTFSSLNSKFGTLSYGLTAGFYSTNYIKNNLPAEFYNSGMRGGDFVWPSQSGFSAGSFGYSTIFANLFDNTTVMGLYDISSEIGSSTPYYVDKKPFNFAPRKITYRTYICTNSALKYGEFGNDPDVWLYPPSDYACFGRQFAVQTKNQTKVTLKNLCFEFECNANDSTAMMFYDGDTFLKNITVAALGKAPYAYGFLNVYSNSGNVYIFGENQIDPYVLTQNNWNNQIWKSLNGIDYPDYYPGYGCAFVGNTPQNDGTTYPTWLSQGFVGIKDIGGGSINFMDYGTDRRVGRDSYLNASIILDGAMNSPYFYALDHSTRLTITDQVFVNSQTFSISTMNVTKVDNGYGTNVNKFNFNKGNVNDFLYFYFYNNNALITPKVFGLVPWLFTDEQEPYEAYQISPHILCINNGQKNKGYEFQENNFVMNLSGVLFNKNDIRFNSISKNYIYYDPPYLKYIVNRVQDMLPYDTLGFYRLTSPLDSNSTYKLDYYADTV